MLPTQDNQNTSRTGAVLIPRRGGRVTPTSRPDYDQVAKSIARAFPLKGFSDSVRGNRSIVETIRAHLPAGSSVLDFGSGTCRRSAFLALCGYLVCACDDLGDQWHSQDGNREKIAAFARQMGIDFFRIEPRCDFPYRPGQFDLVMMTEVLEHLHDSPLELVGQALEWTTDGGFLLVTVPNAANIRKRVGLLLGRTNYPSFEDFFWYPPPWRGHVREYVIADLRQLCRFLHLEVEELRGIHLWVDFKLQNRLARQLYLAFTALVSIPGLRDTLLLLARKPGGWNRQEIERGRAALS